jgi:trans-aconitate methyltransferase
MPPIDPIALLFEGLDKLGPGGDEHTSHVLRMLPQRRVQLVVDAGCGTGRQTLVLARELKAVVHAVDTYEPFLVALRRRAQQQQLDRFVQTHHLDMKNIPDVFQDIDLLWSEGSAYNIGFVTALETWRAAIADRGLAVVSELSWLTGEAPQTVKEFFDSCYPAMQAVKRNATAVEEAGYRLLATHTLPPEAWIEGYYDVLAPRAKHLLDHPEPSVRELAAETVKEIEVFNSSDNSYGYVFYVLQRSRAT